MKLNTEFKQNTAIISFTGIVLVLFLLIFEILISAESHKADAKLNIEAANYTAALKSKVDRELNALLFVSNGLSSYLTIYHRNLEQQKVQNLLADLYARTKNVRNLAVAVGYKITYMHPIKSNEKAIGIDYRQLPQQWPQVKAAIDSHQGVLVGPMDLVQGGKGLIYRYPVYINQAYWGLLSTVINSDAFFKSAFKELVNDEYAFAIRNKNTQEVFYGDPQLFNQAKVYLSTSDNTDVAWEWAVMQKTEKASHLILITRLMGIAIAVLIAALVYFFLRERKMLTALAMHDSLTGVANRRLLDIRLEQALAHAKRFNRNLALLFLDIDHFKQLNDTHGHDVGDALLKTIALRLKSSIRDIDTLSRISGDEFVIVLAELNDINAANSIASKIVHAFKDGVQVLGKRIDVSLSIGVAAYGRGSEESPQSLMKKADIALYQAKVAGRNQFKVYTEVEQKSLFDIT
ncbi:MAG: diguanylate cyclase [Methylophilus sp.]|nr:diguanylate cyclase [Methylophilus sp.]